MLSSLKCTVIPVRVVCEIVLLFAVRSSGSPDLPGPLANLFAAEEFPSAPNVGVL